MTMKLALVIGASNESIHAINVAKQKGYTIWAFDQDQNASGFPYADKSYAIDINDTPAIVKQLDGHIPNIILPVPIGRSLISTGKLNDAYNLFGISEKNAELCTDKYIFHTTLHQKGLRNISCSLIQNENQKDITWNTFPAILKPRFGAGSRAVSLVANQKQLFDTLSLYMPLKEDFIIEDCIEGPEFGVDGGIINGKLEVTLLRQKINTPPPVCQCVGYFSLPKNSDTITKYNSVTVFLNKLISVLEIQNGLFHADLIYNTKTGWFPIEFSPRPSGHNLHNLFTIKCTNIDVIKEYLNCSENLYANTSCFISQNIKPMLIHFFNFEKVHITGIPDEKYLYSKYPLVYYKCNMKKNDWLGEVIDGKSIIERGFFILEADSIEKLDVLKNLFLAEFKTEGDYE